MRDTAPNCARSANRPCTPNEKLSSAGGRSHSKAPSLAGDNFSHAALFPGSKSPHFRSRSESGTSPGSAKPGSGSRNHITSALFFTKQAAGFYHSAAWIFGLSYLITISQDEWNSLGNDYLNQSPHGSVD